MPYQEQEQPTDASIRCRRSTRAELDRVLIDRELKDENFTWDGFLRDIIDEIKAGNI